jgi:hypothetical protein
MKKEEKAKCMRRTDGGAVKSPGENLKRLGLGLGLGVQLQPAVQAMRWTALGLELVGLLFISVARRGQVLQWFLGLNPHGWMALASRTVTFSAAFPVFFRQSSSACSIR